MGLVNVYKRMNLHSRTTRYIERAFIKMVSSTELTLIRAQATQEAIAYTQSFHPAFKATTGMKLSKLYFCASDQDGFPLNFDDIWQIVGYRRKDNAKASLVSRKLGLKENVDYKITPMTEANQTTRWGGHNREDIWLTARGFSQFALAAQTKEGVALRDFLLYLTSQFKVLMTNLKAGHVRIAPGGEADSDRLKACASQRNLTGVLNSIDFTTGQTYFKVNNETNRIVTGRDVDTANELETNKHQHVNGDNLSEIQLAAVKLGEMFSAENLAEAHGSGKLRSDIDIIQSHRQTFQSVFTPEGLKDIQQAKRVNNRCIKDAPKKRKRKRKAIIDKKQKSMTQYFGSRV